MSLEIVVMERMTDIFLRRHGVYGYVPRIETYDPNGHDGEWHAYVRIAHEVVEWDGYGVPLFEGDVERREWEAQRCR